MKLKVIKNRRILAAYFHQDFSLHAYSLGDLDDFYWSRVTCFGLDTFSGAEAVSVLYQGDGLPVLLAFSQPGLMNKDYFLQLSTLLPDQFYAHLSPNFDQFFADRYEMEDFGEHYKMSLEKPGLLFIPGMEKTSRLTEDDLPEMIKLYEVSYPGNAFDPRMILTEQYFGYRDQGKLVSIGGVHVYSQDFEVATLGNITTHPDFRNRGFGRVVTARICSSLLDSVNFIGLNVKCDNFHAINLYKSLGFKISSKFGEFSFKKAPKPLFSL